MSWKPAVAGAIVVAIVGALVGVAIGGGGDPEVVTETVEVVSDPLPSEETELAPDAESGDVTETEPTTEAEPETAPTGEVPLTEAVSPEALNSSKGDAVLNCVQPGGGSAFRGLLGEPLTDPAVFEILESDRIYCGPWRVVLPVSEYKSFSARVGWADNVPEQLTTEFAVYGDSIGSEPLYSDTFEGPSDVGELDVDLEGVDQMILQWNLGDPLKDTSENIVWRFILDQAYLTQ